MTVRPTRCLYSRRLTGYLAPGFLALLVACQNDVTGPAGSDDTPFLNHLAGSDSGAVTLDPQNASLFSAANAWTTRRSGPPPARVELVAGTINGVVYVIGGDAGAGPIANVDAYNVATNTWSPRQPLPGARSDMNGASVINGKLYVSGGMRPGSTLTRVVFVYDPRANRWTKTADMPVAGGNGAQGVIGGRLYVYVGSTEGTGALLRYTPATNTWVTLGWPPVGHEKGVGGVINGRFYLAGGCCDRTNNSATRNLSVYNPATNSWTTKAPMATSRKNAAGGVINGKFYVAGGSDDADDPFSSVEVYDPATNRWAFARSMPTARTDVAAAVAGGKLYVIGGWDEMRNQAYTP